MTDEPDKGARVLPTKHVSSHSINRQGDDWTHGMVDQRLAGGAIPPGWR